MLNFLVAHPKTTLSVMFVLGILFRFFIRGYQAKTSPLRGYPTMRSFWKANWIVFLIRTVLVNVWLFVIWLYHPDWASWLLIKFNVPASIANWTPITPNLVSAPNFGLWVDVALDKLQLYVAPHLPAWVPNVLKGEIPCYIDNMVNTERLKEESPNSLR